MTRKAKLEKALACPVRGDGYSSITRNWMAGESDTYAVLAPLHATLIEAVEALESILDVGESTMGLRVPNMNQTAKEALAKIDKALEYQLDAIEKESEDACRS